MRKSNQKDEAKKRHSIALRDMFHPVGSESKDSRLKKFSFWPTTEITERLRWNCNFPTIVYLFLTFRQRNDFIITLSIFGISAFGKTALDQNGNI
jgi:hypothetical protein